MAGTLRSCPLTAADRPQYVRKMKSAGLAAELHGVAIVFATVVAVFLVHCAANAQTTACCQCAAGQCFEDTGGGCGACLRIADAVCGDSISMMGAEACDTFTPTPTRTATPTPVAPACCQCEGRCFQNTGSGCAECVPVPNAVCSDSISMMGAAACETFTPTATPTPVPCVGDCGRDGAVTVDELLIMVNIALGNSPAAQCAAGDANLDGQITIDEILRAVNDALVGCLTVSQ